jgi:hypothetical protein
MPTFVSQDKCLDFPNMCCKLTCDPDSIMRYIIGIESAASHIGRSKLLYWTLVSSEANFYWRGGGGGGLAQICPKCFKKKLHFMSRGQFIFRKIIARRPSSDSPGTWYISLADDIFHTRIATGVALRGGNSIYRVSIKTAVVHHKLN